MDKEIEKTGKNRGALKKQKKTEKQKKKATGQPAMYH